MDPLSIIREYNRGNWTVRLEKWPGFDHPGGTISWDNAEAKAEYIRKLKSGEYPWYCLAARVRFKGRTLAVRTLGWCDTTNIHARGVRDLVHEAIQEARDFVSDLQGAA